MRIKRDGGLIVAYKPVTPEERHAAGGMDGAQKLLGHKHVTMTQHDVRARAGERVQALRKPGIVEKETE